MSLIDRYREEPGSSKREAFSCEHYSPITGSKRCTHYRSGGACFRAPDTKCVEWLKVNKPAADPSPSGPTFALTHPTSPRVPDPRPGPQESPRSHASRPTAACACGLTPDDLSTFRDLHMEVCIETRAGEIWLVPEYSERPRVELSPEHAAFMVHVLRAFPGARIVSVSQKTINEEINR